jgi:hypothetical protein
MDHKNLDYWVSTQLDMSSTTSIIFNVVTEMMKTVVIRSDYNGELWLFQSTIDENGVESQVDVIRLEPFIVESIMFRINYINKELKI